MTDDIWITLKNGEELHLGDHARLTTTDGEVFEGNLNEIHEDYLILANTGHSPIPDYGTTLGFANATIAVLEKM